MEPIKYIQNSKEKTMVCNEWACWNCGFYDSDTPGFLAHPELHRDLLRNPAAAKALLSKAIRVYDD